MSVKRTVILPRWKDVLEKARMRIDLTPLEAFVYENEPVGEEREWRALLTLAFEEVLNASEI